VCKQREVRHLAASMLNVFRNEFGFSGTVGRSLTSQKGGFKLNKTGFGVIGAGGWGSVHIQTYHNAESAEMVAVSDLREDRGTAVASKYGAKYYADYHELLADDEISAVSIVTPDFSHHEIALAAAKAGKHILCEKPLAITSQECTDIIRAAEEAGVKLMVDFHNRWSPLVYQAWEAIKNDQIGEPQHAYYRLSDRIFVPTEMLPWAGKSTVEWFIGSHSIDTMRWLIGDEPVRVYAVSRSRLLKSMGIDTPDFYQIILEFRNGATLVIENSWILPNTMPIIIDLKCQIVGNKGCINIDASHHRAIEKYTEEKVEYPDVFVMPIIHGEMTGFAVESIRHFIDCVVNDKAPMVTGNDGLVVTRVIEAIEESVRTGMPVLLDT
jgi:predicted dehydrogenase